MAITGEEDIVVDVIVDESLQSAVTVGGISLSNRHCQSGRIVIRFHKEIYSHPKCQYQLRPHQKK